MDSLVTFVIIVTFVTLCYAMLRFVTKLNEGNSLVINLLKKAKRNVNVLYIIIKRIAPPPHRLRQTLNYRILQEGE